MAGPGTTQTIALPPDCAAHLGQSADHLRRGDAVAALRAASEACHSAPDRPQPHYAYGQAWLALNQPGRARQAFAAAVRLAPGWADAWVNYGIARYREGRTDDAKAAMRQALRAEPGHAAAMGNLGAFMRLTGEHEAAEMLLRDSLSRQPDNIAVRLNLAADLLLEGRSADALMLLDQVPPPADPVVARHFQLQRALALILLKRPAAAREAVDAFRLLGPCPAELAPLLHWRLVLLAMMEGDPGRARAAADVMERALDEAGGRTLPEHRIMAHYDLAKFWSGQGHPAAAFAHWRKGHALLRPTQPFDRGGHRAFVDACIEALGFARLNHGMRAGNSDAAPVFIVGMPRSGTTLCEQILGAHGHVFGAGERTALGNAFTALAGAHTAGGVAAIATQGSVELDAVAGPYLAALHALAPGKARIVDKMPGNYLLIGLAALLMPGARFIWCTRDPRDIGLSIFTFRFYGSHGYAHDLADLGWTIAQQERLMRHWQAALPGRVLRVALHDWVHDFDATLDRVLEHVGLPSDPACARFHEQSGRVRTVSRSQVRQPVNARGLGRWKAYAAELTPLITELDAAGLLADWDRADISAMGADPPDRVTGLNG